MYRVEFSQLAQKFLDKLDEHISNRIEARLKKLGNNPVPKDAKFIFRDRLGKVFRYRVGDYRSLYRVKDKEKMVLVAKIDKRPKIYHR